MNGAMYLFCMLAWGLNFFAVRIQGIAVPVAWSLAYRLVAATVVFLVILWIVKPQKRPEAKSILWMLAFGFFNFAASYLALYFATSLIPAALVTLIFSLKTIGTPVQLRIFLGEQLAKEKILGGALGICGVAVLVSPMLKSEIHSVLLPGIGYAVLGTLLTSCGDVCSARNASNRVHPIQANALGLGTAALIVSAYAYSASGPPAFVFTLPYIGALAYLTVIATCIAWLFYLQLVARIGAANSGYMVAFFPLVAGIASVALGESSISLHLMLACVLACIGGVITLRGNSRTLIKGAQLVR